MFEELKAQVAEANRRLPALGLVTLTWGNVSGISEDRQAVAIKPSGVPYESLRPDDIVVVDLSGRVIDGQLRPSTDTLTHLAIYRSFPEIGGVCHTHSHFATVFSQLRREIPCFGTTHADHFCGPIPLTRVLSATEVEEGYELNTGRIIVERFRVGGLNPLATPGVLVAGHGPFTWGRSAREAVENAVALEEVASIAWHMLVLEPDPMPIEGYILQKHHERKHGPAAYYGQQRRAAIGGKDEFHS
ncbi:L-ribulose-5-phosphate 4-epimerase AraD [Thermogutta sp.]|uniref:L-ribulose-5-phosphate 4-epimerase AraD n=1 Tax=Thermogutta sp. TaxID=1962930 RepID=UPI00321F7B46